MRRQTASRVVVFLVACAAAGCAARQPTRSFADLPSRIKPGHTVFVIDSTGIEVRGKVAALTPTAIKLEGDAGQQTIDASRIRQVQRYGDGLLNGTLIGLAIAIPGAFLSGQFLGVPFWGAAGAGIDAMMRSRHQVYLAPDATP